MRVQEGAAQLQRYCHDTRLLKLMQTAEAQPLGWSCPQMPGAKATVDLASPLLQAQTSFPGEEGELLVPCRILATQEFHFKGSLLG